MRLLEAGLYTLVLAILLVSAYALPHFSIQNAGSKAASSTPDSTESKGVTTDNTSPETLEMEEPHVELRRNYSGSWIVDDTNFQLERRAIFSKVCLKKLKRLISQSVRGAH